MTLRESLDQRQFRRRNLSLGLQNVTSDLITGIRKLKELKYETRNEGQ